MKKINLLVLLLRVTCLANAQKLPNVQAASQLLPPKITIDGKLNE